MFVRISELGTVSLVEPPTSGCVLLGGLLVDEGVEDLFRCRCDVGGVDVGGVTHFSGPLVCV